MPSCTMALVKMSVEMIDVTHMHTAQSFVNITKHQQNHGAEAKMMPIIAIASETFSIPCTAHPLAAASP